MPATNRDSDAAMMALYRGKKFGVARPRFEGNIPTFAGAAGLPDDGGSPTPRTSNELQYLFTKRVVAKPLRP